MKLFLVPKDLKAVPAWDKNPREVEVSKETEQAWYGKPLNNPACPELIWPKFAWQSLEEKCVRE